MMLKRWLFAAAAAALICTPALAAAPSVIVQPSALQSAKVSYKLGSTTKKKTIFCLQKTPGDAKSVDGGMQFTSFSVTLAQLKERRSTASKIATYTQLASVGKKTCAKILRSGPSPTPTPTPSTGTSNFDSGGNVTEKGKTTFGIPSNLTGNISIGKTLTQSYCSCHIERLGRSFPTLRTATSQAPMFYDTNQLPDSALANITAYLNRFNP